MGNSVITIYKVTNRISEKSYIGQTSRSIEVRWRQHCSSNKNCTALHRAIEKYGKSNFIIFILAHCEEMKQANQLEKHYISVFDTLTPNGYNLRSGGENSLHSEETKEKLSKLAKNRVFSETHKRNISEGRIGVHHSEETKKKIGKANKIANLGHRHSAKTKKKMSLAKLGNKNALKKEKNHELSRIK